MSKVRSPRFAHVLGLVIPLALLLVLPASAAALEQRLIAADGDDVGWSVAIDGNVAVVGAPETDGDKGAVFVFNRAGDTWVRTGRLTASDGAAGHDLGLSVAIDGDTIVAGAPGAASAYTFATTGPPARTETAKLTASDAGFADNLGASVAIEGDTIVAGNWGDDLATFDEGSVYTFTRTGAAARMQTAKLTASDALAFDRLGVSVAIQGDTIVAGATGDPAFGYKGAVYTFARTGAAARNQTAKLTASDAAPGDDLGNSVAIEGATIAAGAPGDDGRGSLYTFARTGAAARNENAKLTASDRAAGDDLGESVSIRAPFIVAGAPGDDGAGSLYSFESTGGPARNQVGKLVPADGLPGDELGFSIAMDSVQVVAGAPGDDVGANVDQGSALAVFGDTPLLPGASAIRPGACTNLKVGTAAAEVLIGTTGGDRIRALGGNDQVRGLAGDDCLLGGPGGDRLLGALGADRLQGDSGNDIAAGGSGRDRLTGGSGRDRLNGDASNDRLSGGSAADRLTGSGGGDRLSGNSGGDRLSGNSGGDRLSGGSGRDRLAGGSGGDRLTGGSGRDRLSGNSGNDRLSGGSGNDRLVAGRGRNRLSGGSGNDRLNALNDRRDVVRCGAGDDRVRADAIDLLIGCELVARAR